MAVILSVAKNLIVQNSKHEILNSKQTQITEIQNGAARLWKVEFCYCLGFGVLNLDFSIAGVV